MPGPETQGVPETKEAPENPFEMKVSPEAQVLMDAWKMEIKDNSIYWSGVQMDSSFYGAKELNITQKEGNLLLKEVDTNGDVMVYKGSSPEQFKDNIMYIGYMRYIEGHPTDSRVPAMLDRVGEIIKKYPGNPDFTQAAIHATE